MKEKVPLAGLECETPSGGALAWEHAQAAEKLDFSSLGSRLLSHAVADRTATKNYLPAVERWLNFVEKHQLPCTTWGERARSRVAGL